MFVIDFPTAKNTYTATLIQFCSRRQNKSGPLSCYVFSAAFVKNQNQGTRAAPRLLHENCRPPRCGLLPLKWPLALPMAEDSASRLPKDCTIIAPCCPWRCSWLCSCRCSWCCPWSSPLIALTVAPGIATGFVSGFLSLCPFCFVLGRALG